jgi:hypothetical protein
MMDGGRFVSAAAASDEATRHAAALGGSEAFDYSSQKLFRFLVTADFRKSKYR